MVGWHVRKDERVRKAVVTTYIPIVGSVTVETIPFAVCSSLYGYLSVTLRRSRNLIFGIRDTRTLMAHLADACG